MILQASLSVVSPSLPLPMMLLSARITGYTEAVDIGGKAVTTHAGTYLYMSPEVILGNHPYSFPVDCWGLGCIGYELCTRHPVYSSASGSLLDLLAGILTEPYNSSYLVAKSQARSLLSASILIIYCSAVCSPSLLLLFSSLLPPEHPSGFSDALPTLIHGLLNRDAKSRLTLATFLSHSTVKAKAASFGISL